MHAHYFWVVDHLSVMCGDFKMFEDHECYLSTFEELVFLHQIFFDEQHIGGYDETRALEKENKLQELLK